MSERVMVLTGTIIRLGKSWKLNEEIAVSIEHWQSLAAYLPVDTGDGGLTQVWQSQDPRSSRRSGGSVDAGISIDKIPDLWGQVEEWEWFLGD
jgi:hypothetical protein